MIQDMKTKLTRLFTVALLIMVSMGAMADVKVLFGEKGDDKVKTDGDKIEATYDGGTIVVTQKVVDATKVTVFLTVTPNKGYTMQEKNVIEAYATAPANIGTTRAPLVSETLTLDCEDFKDEYSTRTYYVDVDPKLALWVKKAIFSSGSKGGGTRTDHSGVYYIKNNNDATYYLCTSTVFYDGNHYADSGEMPYLTTAKTSTIGDDWDKDAVWRIIKAESGDNNYYVVHAVDGKYLTLNDDPSTYSDKNGNRLSLHLQYFKDEDKSLFNITKDNSGWYNISPKNKSTWSLNPAGDNYDNRAGTVNKTVNITGVGNNKNVGGLIGLWQNSDAKSKWQFEQVDDKPICEAPTIVNNGTISFSCSTEGATVYYTIDNTIPTTSSSSGSVTGDIEDIDVVWARATTQNSEPYYWSPLTVYEIPQCEKPTISIINGKLNLSCATDGATIFYIINGSEPTMEYDPNNKPDVTENDIIKAVATKNGYHKSKVASILPSQTVHNTSEMNNMYAHYVLASDFVVSSSVGTEAEPFCGVIDGGLNTFSNFNKALVAYANGATIKNVILDNVTIGENANGYAGAICSEALGDTRIYNCGVKSGTISGTNAGSIVGKLDGNSRVINCFSFATVSGGTWGAGIVGYNSFSSTKSDLRTMVMNCMFYGEISSNSKLSPIYGGEKITNVSNLNGYNYYRFDANYSKNNEITDYNCALAAEENYLTRFEFFRNMLNSNRELAAWYATGNPSEGKGIGNACKMAKWVLDPADKPYPILKSQDYYPSTINYEDAPTLGTINLTINESNTTLGGQTKPIGASINSTYPTTLTVYDKDLAHKHFNYRTVRLPYYNEVGTGNCTKNKVVTGWKITGFSGGTQGHFVKDVLDYSGTTHRENEYPPYNFADRYCTNKDLYDGPSANVGSDRVFSQGAYYDVPEGVTGITIEPYWGTAVYLSDPTYDVAYPKGYGDNNANAVFVSNMGNRYINGNTASINDDNQTVYTDYASAFTQVASTGTVYDNAIVLVGNYHHYWGQNSPSTTKAFTIMSADLNNDCEPDYSFIVQHGTNRQDISAIRFDFINSPGLGMIQKVETDKAIPKHGIWRPKGWFEVTNTTLIQFTQFEYDGGGKPAGSPLILLGGLYDQFVTSRYYAANSTEYIHLGSNVWMKEFCNGTHTANTNTTRHIPISVTGGEFESFYLTGTFKPSVVSITDNAECYISGGKFGDMAGAGQEQLKGDVTWLIDHADITNFYGGGINDQKPVLGHIYVEINNSQVGLYCGGPKFGNMQDNKKVTTKAKGSTFGNFYGAGYGGTSYFRYMTKDKTGEKDWDTWNADYTRKYVSGQGISTGYECEFIPYSGGESGQADYVGRFYVLYASLSLAKTKNVESTLEDCHITGSFYGGGKLGSVDGNITSTLKNCTDENVFGAGFSASVEKVNVVPKGTMMKTNPAYNESVGVFTDGTYPDGVPYTWTQVASVSKDHEFDDTNHLIYTTTNLTTLGTVTGSVTLTIDGNTILTDGKVMSVTKSVYGGGEESDVEGNTQVYITGGTITQNVFGGGKGEADEFLCSKAMVGRNDDGRCEDPGSDTNKDKGTKVTISNGTVNGNVYGGGEVGRVEWNTQVTIGNTSGEGTPIINGNVFGAGKGKETHGYAALVRGNSSVTIQGNAKVRENVYGGGEQATVGRYWVKNIPTTLCENDENETEIPTPPGDLPDEMPYKTRRGGKSTVIVQGSAQIGPDNGATETAGHIFGAGKGVTPVYNNVPGNENRSKRMVTYDYDPDKPEAERGPHSPEAQAAGKWEYYPDDHSFVWEYFVDDDDPTAANYKTGEAKYLEFLQTLALVTGTDVTINGATVKGNVYGGSESGFVQDDTYVKIQGGTIGTADSYGYVFGGGKGLVEFSEAGLVKGNATVAVSDGTIQRNVYGGGELGHVGTFTETADGRYIKKKDQNGVDMNTGLCTVSITGGKIGPDNNSNQEIGNVFGAGKGKDDTFKCEKAMTMETSVSVGGGTVNGNVYGGGEVGRVEYDTEVTIGRKSNETAGSGTGKPIINGSVFGAGRGVATHGYSALVRGNTRVDVEGAAGAMVKGDVFGGGEIASVGRYGLNTENMPNILLGGGGCVVNVRGSVVITGNVFGAGQGVDPSTFNATGTDKTKLSRRMTVYTNSSEFKDDHTTETGTWELYDGSVTPNIIWEYYQNEGAYSDYLQTLALATAPNVTIDGNAKVKGSVFGGGELGLTKGSVTVTIQNGTIGTLDTSGNPVVGTGDVYGGGSLANTNTTHYVGLKNADESPKYAVEEVDGKTIKYIETKEVHPTTIVRLIGGEVYGDAYGGGLGRLASDDVSAVEAVVVGDVLVDLNGTTTVATDEDGRRTWTTNTGTTDPDMTGCIVRRVFGCNNINGTPQKNVTVHVYATQSRHTSKTTIGAKFVKDNVDLEKIKKNDVLETDEVYLTRLKAILADRLLFATALSIDPATYQAILDDEDSDAAAIKTAITGITGKINEKTPEQINALKYDVEAVYGGGNEAAYVPETAYKPTVAPTGSKTQVIIEGCDYTCIETVYGGGNAAPVPETNVEIRSAYEIGYVFGGGNGKDNKSDGSENPGADIGQKSDGKPYGTGNANSTLEGGLIHEAYGGSNQKGVIKGSINQTTDPDASACELDLRKVVGAGKYADIDQDVNMILSCQPENKVNVLFAGADEANVNGNITLTITNGNFGQVFGGNNLGGAVKGRIIVNVEETGCRPINIDELYLCGNNAAYSVYGYYQSDEVHLVTGKKILKPRESSDDSHKPVKDYNRENDSWTVYSGEGGDTFTPYPDPVLNVISCTHIGQVFGGGYGTGAFIYGNPTVNINMIQGEHYTNIASTADNPNRLGEIGTVYGGGNAADVIGNTTVNIGMATTVTLTSVDDDTDTTNDEKHPSVLGAYITGNVFGGGNLAEVSGNTNVNICGTQNPVLDSQNNPVLDSQNKPTYTDTSVSHSGTFAVSIGNSVYGGGNAADIQGNTFVTMADGYVFNGIFGGGLAGSVGTFTRETNVTDWGHDPDDSNHKGTCIGKPTTCTAGGTCYVVVSGGQIGPVEVATEGMNRKTNGHGDPVPQGWVWGAGCGLVENPSDDPDTHFKTYVNNTDVTIKGNAFILESIIGGGEFGRVLGNTLVKIEGGQIGVGANKTETVNGVVKPVAYTTDQWTAAETAVRGGNASDINTIAAQMPACSHFPYGRNTGTEQNPHWVYDTYDPFADEYKTAKGSDLYPGGSTDHASDGKTWIGCVFAGGSGYMPYKAKDATTEIITDYDWVSSAGWVEGDAEVRISGGHILTNVYGGNEYTDVKGKCKVTMTGGTIGVPRTLNQIKENPMIGNIFGAGRGDPRVHFNKTTNVEDVEIEISGGTIFGSVFGGGEDGHVLRDVAITIENTTVTVPAAGEGQSPTTTTITPHIGTWGTSYVDGNVFGGGRGFTGEAYTAGNVAGSVKLEIKGGNILGSVYGGGRMGSVGYGLFDEGVTGYGEMRLDTDTEEGFNTSFTKGRGHTDIIISGGTIGNNYEYIIPNSTNMPDGLSVDNIGSWTPVNWTAWKNHNNIPKTEFDTTTGRLSHTKGGNVFAGGMGNLYEQDGTTYINKVDWWRLGCVKSTKLTITGGTIKSNVYGGGELGQVVGYHTIKNSQNQDVNLGTEITIQGSSTIIGTEVKDASNNTQYTFGSVFGGGYGSLLDKITVKNGTSDVTSYPKYIAGLIKEDTKIDMQGGAVKASIYGGGEMASVGESTTSGETTTTTGNTYVAVSGGTVGIEPITVSGTMRYFGGAKMGNVYGGGSGHNNTVRSGRILKNTNVTISGGTIYHNVYGGGAYGTVGDFTYSERDETVTVNGVETTVKKVSGISGRATSGTGVATVTITGGTIGYDGKENGMVFGSSRGDINMPGKRDDYTAWVYDTHVTIGTTGSQTGPQINGTVYGSGENGHTFNDTSVEIHSGTIGIEEGLPITSDGVSYSGAAYPYRGNVYGGGCGTDTYTLDDDKDGNPDDKNNDGHAEEYYNPEAGIVRGNATVTMDGGHVVRAVYGGGAMGSVGTFTTAGETYLESHSEVPLGKPISCIDGSVEGQNETGLCTVTISGGKIGPKRQVMPNNYGNVFGAGRGEAKDTLEFPNLNISAYFNKTVVTISGTALVRGSVYGGSESGHVLGDTWVKIQGGQIGCGKDSEGEPYNSWDVTSLLPCASWDYEEDGYAYDMYADADDYDSKGGMRVATDGHTFYGNVFGGGSGYTPYAPGKWIRSAGRVEGNTQVDITGGHILTNVYGGNECTDVLGRCTVNMSGGTVGVPRTKAEILQNPALGYLFGAGKGDKRVLFNTWTNVKQATVSVSGGRVYGSVYGGGEDGHVGFEGDEGQYDGDAATTISGDAHIGTNGNSGYDGNVFGGGQGSSTALTAGVVQGNVTLNIRGGQIDGSVYGGGRLASVGTHLVAVDHDNYGELQDDNLHGNITVNLTGGIINQDVFGGSVGSTKSVSFPNSKSNADMGISRDVIVELNKGIKGDEKGCVVKGNIFGCNNLNSSPKGHVKVYVHATQNADASQINDKESGRYDVLSVYGGGNMAAYEPVDLTTGKTEVIIDGCGLTSIRQVYGGGNAASTPATDVTVNGTYEIFELFGGGNGADDLPDGSPNPGANVGYKDYHLVENDPAFATKDARVNGEGFAEYRYGTGVAAVNIMGGTVHRVFGGSNTKGNVRQTALTLLEEGSGCSFCVDEAYGGGKSAPMDAEAKIHMACIPGLKAAYGGAEAADIQGDVTLNITNGTFERVFGGNNISGTIRGSITVNIEETGCKPIIIGELYGGGNQAGYSVRGYKKVTEGTSEVWKPRMPEDALEAGMDGTFADPQVNIKSFTSIGEVYGGGYGEGAVMVGSPTVNINVTADGTTEAQTYTITKTVNNQPVTDYASNFDEETITIDEGKPSEHQVTRPSHVKGKVGAINNVFGGGNAAKVVGDTHVNIGTESTVDFETDVDDPNTTDVDESAPRTVVGADIRGNVYGGGNKAEVTGGTNVTIGKEKVTTP